MNNWHLQKGQIVPPHYSIRNRLWILWFGGILSHQDIRSGQPLFFINIQPRGASADEIAFSEPQFSQPGATPIKITYKDEK